MRIYLRELVSVSEYLSLERLKVLAVIARFVPLFYSSLKHVMYFDYPSKTIL